MANPSTIQLGNVAETLFIPLYVRAEESRRADALIHDEKAVFLSLSRRRGADVF